MRGNWPSIDHSILSPSGRVSKRSRAAAMERTRVELFGPEGLQRAPVPQPSKRERLIQRLTLIEGLAANGMHPRAFKKEAAIIRAQLAELTS